MTDQDWIDLGQRAVACRAWRWLPGMRVIDTRTAPRALRIVVKAEGNSYLSAEERSLRAPSGASGGLSTWFGGGAPLAPAVPDLRDPATVGCLLALVREVHGDASGGPVPVTAADRGCTSGGPPVWFVVWSHGPCGDPFNRAEPTEAHALVAALEFER